MSLRLATGQAAFAGDHALLGMLHVALRRSTTAHARVRAADTGAARQLPGVAAVLTWADAPSVLSDVVRFVGDRLAVVAAEEPELARRAAELVEFDLEPLPVRLDAASAESDEACVAGRVSVSEGDVERALAEAELVIEGVWSLPFAPALSLEPPLALSWLDEDRRLVVRTSAESPFRVRGALAERLSLPAARIRVVRPAVAGGGRGRSDLAVEDACALVTLRTGRPAQLALSAAEALRAAPGRPAQRVCLRLGLTRGALVGLEIRLLLDVGADATDAAPLLRSSARQALGLYRIPNLRFTAVAVRTNRPPTCAPRGSDAGVAIALECALDEASARCDRDPSALRREHLRRPGDPGAIALAELGEPQGGDDARQLAELLREIAQPGQGGQATTRAGPLRAGRGLAVARCADPASGQAGAAALAAGEPLAVTATPTRTKVAHSLAAVVADVEVDMDTGGVAVRGLCAVVAGGPFEDARQAAAQVEGALVSALELSLVNRPPPSEAAQPSQAWPGRWPLVAAIDVPPLTVTFVPAGDPLSRFGTAAHAEAAARAAMAALANAIARASTTRPRSLPLDPARLLAALGEAELRA